MIGTFTYEIQRLRFPASCEVCGSPVGQDGKPYYFYAPRGQRARHRCHRCRHGKPLDETSRKAPTAGPVAPGSPWTDPGSADAAWARLCEGDDIAHAPIKKTVKPKRSKD